MDVRPRAVIVVAADRGHRRERVELGKDRGVADVAGVDDAIAAAEERHRLRSQQAMRVRHDPDAWHADPPSPDYS